MNAAQNAPVASVPRKTVFGIPNAIAVILSVLFGLFVVFGSIGFSIWRVLFNPPLVKQTLSNEVVSSDLVPATLEIFSKWRAQQRVQNRESLSGVNEPDIVLLLSFLDAQNWREIKRLLVTDAFVLHLVSTSVDGLYAWIDSGDAWPSITWDMALLKERMSGQQGKDAIMIAYSALPAATAAEIADFQQRLSEVPPGVEVLYNLCQFPAPWQDDQVGDYVDALKAASDNIPVHFLFSKEFGGSSSDQTATLAALKSQLQLVRFVAISGWVFALLLLAAILALKVRSLRTLGLFAGIPLLAGGALTAVIALFGQPVIGQAIANSLAATSDFARQEIADSLGRLTSLIFQPMLILGAILAGSGIVLLVLMSVKLPKKAKA